METMSGESTSDSRMVSPVSLESNETTSDSRMVSPVSLESNETTSDSRMASPVSLESNESPVETENTTETSINGESSADNVDSSRLTTPATLETVAESETATDSSENVPKVAIAGVEHEDCVEISVADCASSFASSSTDTLTELGSTTDICLDVKSEGSDGRNRTFSSSSGKLHFCCSGEMNRH